MDEKKLYKRAEQRVAAKISFYIHAAAFVFSMMILAAVNLAFTPRFLWFLFPLAGWGSGVLIHGLIVFIALSGDLKKRLVENEMQKLRGISANDARTFAPEEKTSDYVPLSWKESEKTSEAI